MKHVSKRKSKINNPALRHMREVAYAPIPERESVRDDAGMIARAEAKRERRMKARTR